MRRVLIVLLAFIGLVLAIAILAPMLVSKEWVRNQTQTAASETLGREVLLSGDIALQILPSVQVRAQNASIANADGFGDASFAQMAELRVSLALFPLITRQFQVEEFVLIEPVIRLQSRNGQNNWTFETSASEAPASTASSGSGFQRQPGALPFEASFGDVRIENGAVYYEDGSQSRRLERLNLIAKLPSVDQPIELIGTFAADGRDMAFELSLASLRGFFEGHETEFSTSLTGPLADLNATGRFLESQDIAFQGQVDMTLPLRALARYLGADLPEGDTFRQFSTQAAFEGATGRVAINAERIEFDDILASGELALNYSGTRPRIRGSITSERIDITPYIPAETSSGPSTTSPGIAQWSDEPMDVAALRTMDLDLNISASLLKALDVEVSNVSANLNVDRGRLVARLNQFRLYDGTGSATAILNARQSTPSMSFVADLENLQALPFLTAAAQFDRLAGLGSFNLDLDATGQSPAQIMNSLSGSGSFSFADGAIRGVNLAQMIRTVQTALETRALPSAFSDTEQTDFSSLNGTFDIQNGVVTNTDLLMLSPLLRVNGQGEVNLGAQTLDYRLTPRAVQSLTGQGGAVDLQGLAVPVRLRGDFNTVSAGIDFEAVAAGLVRQQAGRLLGVDTNVNGDGAPSTEDVVRGLFGQLLNQGGDSDDDDDETDPPN